MAMLRGICNTGATARSMVCTRTAAVVVAAAPRRRLRRARRRSAAPVVWRSGRFSGTCVGRATSCWSWGRRGRWDRRLCQPNSCLPGSLRASSVVRAWVWVLASASLLRALRLARAPEAQKARRLPDRKHDPEEVLEFLVLFLGSRSWEPRARQRPEPWRKFSSWLGVFVPASLRGPVAPPQGPQGQLPSQPPSRACLFSWQLFAQPPSREATVSVKEMLAPRLFRSTMLPSAVRTKKVTYERLCGATSTKRWARWIAMWLTLALGSS